MTQSVALAPQPQPLLVGIDSADEACRRHYRGPNRQLETLSHDPDSIAELVHSLKEQAPGPILVALEQSRGALVHAFPGLEGLCVYPLNPKQLARFREAFYPSGGKNDPTDAELAARFLEHHRRQLRPYRPDSPETRRWPSWPRSGGTSWKTANASCNA